MGHHFLLVEGVNLYANIYDTDQLSVIRGSSFLYKDAVTHIQKEFTEYLEPVSTGASSGLFCLKIASTKAIEGIAEAVTQSLRTHPQFRHLTFLVEHCQAGDILQAKRQLWAQLHFRQLRALTLTPDVFEGKHTSRDEPCELEGIRIAANRTQRKVQATLDKPKRHLSLSVFQRREYGRQQKQDYYLNGLSDDLQNRLAEYRFVPDIETLCENPAYGNLNGKMAVIYIDGNGFGKRQDSYLQKAIDAKTDGIAAQQAFDDCIQTWRNQFLEDIITKMLDGKLPDAVTRFSEDEEDGGGNFPAIRLETLLWGGDEMLFVLPAWLGTSFLQQFFTHTRLWELDDQQQEQFTHAAGVVFCKAKTPIRIIQNLARKLAERVKDKYGRDKDGWDYLVLESVDYPTRDDLDAYFGKRYGMALQQSRPAGHPAAPNWQVAEASLHRLLGDGMLPIRQLYRIVDTFNSNEPQGTLDWNGLCDATQESIQEASLQEQAEFQMLRTLDGANRTTVEQELPVMIEQLFALDMDKAEERAWCWLHLLELWDYLIPAKGAKP
ncbi:hypothetical protein [Candidatus Thiothrix anitrata]|uniref:Type III-B CRISPR-associated protein Cas10/Cmr2 n=1 Tax=Candidatus Thiothrix anitrata TaxID=2823902 RepID=A0ABX7X2V1_9GAMM|nr:hypothetical protein [Candidatus Thiothrix anitrata]QTR49607.1 hypothetical protein J8380_15430 [Candidatus Thiothrix anitrata]